MGQMKSANSDIELYFVDHGRQSAHLVGASGESLMRYRLELSVEYTGDLTKQKYTITGLIVVSHPAICINHDLLEVPAGWISATLRETTGQDGPSDSQVDTVINDLLPVVPRFPRRGCVRANTAVVISNLGFVLDDLTV